MNKIIRSYSNKELSRLIKKTESAEYRSLLEREKARRAKKRGGR